MMTDNFLSGTNAPQLAAGFLYFFLEFDRGSERLTVFKKKISAYLVYFRSGKCRSRYGTDKIRVLTVTEGGETGTGRVRLSNLKEAAEKLGGRRRFRFARLAQVATEDVLTAPIWLVATSPDPTTLI
jgi:hypothetical protein